MEWNYVSKVKKSSGYEDVNDILKKYKSEVYKNMSEEEQKVWIEEVFNIYRNKNIFPITYLNKEGCLEDILKAYEKEVSFNNNTLDLKFNQGQTICKFLFPNLHDVECKNATNNSMLKRFYDDHKLKRAIKLCFDIKKGVMPSDVRGALELIGGNVATNFKPMIAKALYEKYCPKNGIIYDYASGFGGRMIGALCSKNNYRYLGVEPCTETYEHLQELGSLIEEATNTKNRFKIFKIGSEDFKYKKENCVDFAFSSPPYYTLEKYSDEPTQCYNKFNNLEEWFEGYVKPTIQTIYCLLKKDCYYAVNIADFNIGKERIEYVDKWIEISQEVGFEYIEQINMKLSTRKGNGHKDNNGKDKIKKEGIFVFKK